MNTFDVLYQAFRARYSLNRVQELLDRGCKLALIGPDDAAQSLRGYLGQPIRGVDGEDPAEWLVDFSLPFSEEDRELLEECDGAIFLFRENPEDDDLREIAAEVPIQVPCLWLLESDQEVHQMDDLTLPSLHTVPERAPGPIVLKLLVGAFPQLALVLATGFTKFRRFYSRRLTARSATRNGVIAACSSLPVSSVPVVGFLLKFLATSAETMVITASQLRLCLLVAAVHGRTVDFFDRIGELWPVIGGAFGWRALARELVGFVPAAGWAVKTGVAYSGTWAVGEASRLFYEKGQPTDEEVQRELARLARQDAHEKTKEFMANLLEELKTAHEDDEIDELTSVENEAEDQEGHRD